MSLRRRAPLGGVLDNHPAQDGVQTLRPLERDVVTAVRKHVEPTQGRRVGHGSTGVQSGRNVVSAGDHDDRAADRFQKAETARPRVKRRHPAGYCVR